MASCPDATWASSAAAGVSMRPLLPPRLCLPLGGVVLVLYVVTVSIDIDLTMPITAALNPPSAADALVVVALVVATASKSSSSSSSQTLLMAEWTLEKSEGPRT